MAKRFEFGQLIDLAVRAMAAVYQPASSTHHQPGAPPQVGREFIVDLVVTCRCNSTVLRIALYYLHRIRTGIQDRLVQMEEKRQTFRSMLEARSLSCSPERFRAAASAMLECRRDPVCEPQTMVC